MITEEGQETGNKGRRKTEGSNVRRKVSREEGTTGSTKVKVSLVGEAWQAWRRRRRR